MTTYFFTDHKAGEKKGKQERALKRYAGKNGLQYDEGTVFQEWDKLEEALRDGDTVVFKDIGCFVEEAEGGNRKYMRLMDMGIKLIFMDNPTLGTDYISHLRDTIKGQDLVKITDFENIVKLLIYVELDHMEQERLARQMRIKDGMEASEKKPGRKPGTMEKLTPELEDAIAVYLKDGSVLQIDLMKIFGISRNTLKKYAKLIKEKMEQNNET